MIKLCWLLQHVKKAKSPFMTSQRVQSLNDELELTDPRDSS